MKNQWVLGVVALVALGCTPNDVTSLDTNPSSGDVSNLSEGGLSSPEEVQVSSPEEVQVSSPSEEIMISGPHYPDSYPWVTSTSTLDTLVEPIRPPVIVVPEEAQMLWAGSTNYYFSEVFMPHRRISKFEVTQAQYADVMGLATPDAANKGKPIR